jgi:hypothetical protein
MVIGGSDNGVQWAVGNLPPKSHPSTSSSRYHLSYFKLPELWPDSLVLSFWQIDCIFATQRAFSSFNKFCHMVQPSSRTCCCSLGHQLFSTGWPWRCCQSEAVGLPQAYWLSACKGTGGHASVGVSQPSQLMASMLEMLRMRREKSSQISYSIFLVSSGDPHQERLFGPGGVGWACWMSFGPITSRRAQLQLLARSPWMTSSLQLPWLEGTGRSADKWVRTTVASLYRLVGMARRAMPGLLWRWRSPSRPDLRHTSTALYFYGASKKTTHAQGHFWKYVT